MNFFIIAVRFIIILFDLNLVNFYLNNLKIFFQYYDNHLSLKTLIILNFMKLYADEMVIY